jgi:hypothetical protein
MHYQHLKSGAASLTNTNETIMYCGSRGYVLEGHASGEPN